MTVAFADGTRMTLADGSEANGFLQFDLPWLVYVHGKVTFLNKQDGSSNFAVELLPAQSKSEHCCRAA
jgi:hypothetical protein